MSAMFVNTCITVFDLWGYLHEFQFWEKGLGVVGEWNRLLCDVLCWQNRYHPLNVQNSYISFHPIAAELIIMLHLHSCSVLDTCAPSGGKDWYTTTDLCGYRFDKWYTTQTPVRCCMLWFTPPVCMWNLTTSGHRRSFHDERDTCNVVVMDTD